MSKTWEIHYPDGKVIKKDKDDKVYIGNGFYVALQDGSGADDFIKLKNQSAFSIAENQVRVYSNNFDFKTISSKEGADIIKENLVPPLKSNSILIVDSDAYRTTLGVYENGNYSSNSEKKTAGAAAKNKEYNTKKAAFTRRFGFDPTTKSIKELVVAGRSFKLLNEYFDFWRNEHKNDLVVTWRMRRTIDRGNSKCYRIVAMNEEIGFIWVDGESVSWY